MANAKQTDSLTPELKLPNPFEPVSISLDGDETDTFARFVVKPLERGFGITVGNALRRVLLSALPGASVVAVQIEGAPHEFTALKGIKPDVTGIILNLKDLVLKIDENTTELKRIEVDAKGPKVLTAGDLPLPSMVEVINPDLEIATINEGAELHMTIFVGNGRGYVTSEQNKTERRIDTVGVIATDSNYSPIEKVAFHVEPTRVLHDSDFDCLTLEVTTNGSVKPHEAVAMAAQLLVAHFSQFVTLEEKVKDFKITKDETKPEENKYQGMLIEELDLSVRSNNCLKRAGISTVMELTQKSEEEMMKVRNLGKKSLKEVKEKLANIGLHFKDYVGE